jgi:hypothetical protein
MSELGQPQTNPLNRLGVGYRPESTHGAGRLSFKSLGGAGPSTSLRAGASGRFTWDDGRPHCPGFRYVYFTSAMLRGQTIGASSASWLTLSYWMSATGASMNW